MKSIFKYTVKVYGIANIMDFVSLPKKKNTEVKLITEKEQVTLQKYISKNHNISTLSIAICIATGIRIGELSALQWKDIDLEKRILTVNKTLQRIQCNNSFKKTKLIITEPKSESSNRVIPIPECLVELLWKFKGKPDDYVSSGKNKLVKPRTTQYRFAKIFKKPGITSVHFHALRHIFVSNCIKLGFGVKLISELLGYSSVEITLNIYVHSSFERKKKYMNSINLMF